MIPSLVSRRALASAFLKSKRVPSASKSKWVYRTLPAPFQWFQLLTANGRSSAGSNINAEDVFDQHPDQERKCGNPEADHRHLGEAFSKRGVLNNRDIVIKNKNDQNGNHHADHQADKRIF